MKASSRTRGRFRREVNSGPSVPRYSLAPDSQVSDRLK